MTTHARFVGQSKSATDLAVPLQQTERTQVWVRGKRLTYFAGCDYHRLSSHPAVIAAVHSGLEEFGLNVAASRKTTGNHVLYARLESALATHFRVEAATLTSNGYVSNLCLAQALAGEITHALIDERAHGSLRDALQYLGCPIHTFRHRNPTDVQRCIQRCGRNARLVLLTDGLYSHSGEVAPLVHYDKLLPASAMMVVDDAHAAGVLGRNGRGTPEYLGLRSDRILQTVTLSKAFGCYGGAVLGPAAIRQRIIERSGYFVGNTPLPLPLANAALVALRIVQKEPSLRRRLAVNTAYVKAGLREAGLPVNEGPGPMVPIHPKSAADAQSLSRTLLRAGIHPPLIKYSSKENAYFRFVISSEHDAQQLDDLIEVLTKHRIPVVVPPHGS